MTRLAAILAVLMLAGCPRGGAAPAQPAEVEIEWPDAGAIAPTPAPPR